MVKDTLTQQGGINIVGKLLMTAGTVIGVALPAIAVGKRYGEKALKQFRVYEWKAQEMVMPLVARVEKVTREHADATTISIALGLLTLGMCGLWFKLLWSTGI